MPWDTLLPFLWEDNINLVGDDVTLLCELGDLFLEPCDLSTWCLQLGLRLCQAAGALEVLRLQLLQLVLVRLVRQHVGLLLPAACNVLADP